jgi:hypothetical protein
MSSDSNSSAFQHSKLLRLKKNFDQQNFFPAAMNIKQEEDDDDFGIDEMGRNPLFAPYLEHNDTVYSAKLVEDLTVNPLYEPYVGYDGTNFRSLSSDQTEIGEGSLHVTIYHRPSMPSSLSFLVKFFSKESVSECGN